MIVDQNPEKFVWGWPDPPPDYIWTDGPKFPPFLWLAPDPTATEKLWGLLMANKAEVKKLLALATRYYRDLG